MAVIQVIMFCIMLVQGLLILFLSDRSKGQLKTPDNLLEISLGLSIVVGVGALYASLVITDLIC